MELTREGMRPLLDLQRIDSTIDRLDARRAQLPEQVELDRLSEELEAARKAGAEKELGFGGVDRDVGKFEAEIQALDQKIQHESSRLYSGEVSSPKELTSIQAELDGLRRRKNHIEDQLLDLMEKRESAEKELAGSKEAISTLAEKVEQAKAARDDASLHIEQDMTAARTERSSIVPGIPAEALEIYEEIRPKKEGVAVAALERGVCRGCMVAISPVSLDAIRRSDDPLIRCENCRRLLVITS